MDLCEAVSSAGLCMFGVNAFCPAYLLTDPDSRESKQIHQLAPQSGDFLRRIVNNPEAVELPLPLFRQVQMLNAVSGMTMTPGQFLRAGSRCFALEQLLSRRFGGDTGKLPKVLKKESDITPEAYFDARGWDQDGVPAPHALDSLEPGG